MEEVLVLVATAVQVGIGLVLAASGFGKVGRRHEFKGIVDAYRLVPARAVPVVASIVMIAEIVTGASLVAGWAPAVFAVVAAMMFAGFGLAMAINLARGRRMIDCGCFRSVRQPLEWRLVIRNSVAAIGVLATSAAAMATTAATGAIEVSSAAASGAAAMANVAATGAAASKAVALASLAPLDPQRWLHAVPAGIALAIIYFALNAVWSLDASRALAFPRS